MHPWTFSVHIPKCKENNNWLSHNMMSSRLCFVIEIRFPKGIWRVRVFK